VLVFSPPDVDAVEVAPDVVVAELELELDPQPAANSSTEQAIAIAGRPLRIGAILSVNTS
jgi:hypothetical protein